MTSAIIVAAGQGTRMGSSVDKLFLEVHGRPVLAHTWGRFDAAACVDDLVLVTRAGMEGAVSALAERWGFRKPFRVVPGGRERQDSVWQGLQALPADCALVAIQDAARPCVTEELIAATVHAARETGAAVAAQRVADTVKESADGQAISRHLDRARLWAVQTPQTFRREVIVRALAAVRDQGGRVTDDTAACEWIGQPVRLVESLTPNPKLTTAADVAYLEFLLQFGQPLVK